MGICTTQYYTFPLLPRRIRSTSCEAFADLNRWVAFNLSMDLTPSQADNDIISEDRAWSIWDLPVSVATQDIDDAGNDLLLIAIADRWYRLDDERFYDEFGWDTKTPIYRKIVFGPIPSMPDSAGDQGVSYDPFLVKVFRRFSFELNEIPADTVTSKYRISVEEDGRPETRRQGIRETRKRCDAKISARGLSFLVTIEHQAEEQFAPNWWRAEWDVKGPRIRPNPHTSA